MFAASKTSTATSGYQISRSLRFNSADSAYLNRTPATTTNRRTWTWSGWVKLATTGTARRLFNARIGTTGDQTFIQAASDNTLFIGGNSGAYDIRTTAVYRDPSAWYHVVMAFDTTLATSTDRIKLYVNGVQVTALQTATYPSQNLDTFVNTTNPHSLGAESGVPSEFLNGYMTEVNFIDGQQLTPSSFGETSATTGVWQPKAFAGTYGTNGFYLNFSDNSNTTAATLGKDYSGNGNNWTPNNFSVTAGIGNDSLVDVPTLYGVDTGAGGSVRGNYATLNPLILNSSTTLTNGNLDYTNTSMAGAAPGASFSTIGMTSGKFYAEFTLNLSNFLFGVWGNGTANLLTTSAPTYYWHFGGSVGTLGLEKTSGTSSGSGGTVVAGNVYAVAVDLDSGTISFYQNNTLAYSVTGMTFTGPLFFTIGAWTLSITTGPNSLNFGQRAFAYTAPSGFKALCTQNLPTPTIGATTATTANKFFDVSTWTGNGGAQTIANSGSMQPDLIWAKSRSNGSTAQAWTDAVRGPTALVTSDSSGAEQTLPSSWVNPASNGIALNTTNVTWNGSGYTYVGWQWNAGSGSTVSNTSGSITSTVSANTTSGFSVVTYTGNVTAGATVGHGLGVAPQMIIVKCRVTAFSWRVYHVSVGNVNSLLLNSTNASSALSSWNSTTPTSTVFTLGTDVGTNQDGSTFVAYCFAPIAGYSAFGSYTGNGSSDGTFVYTGFRPAFVMIKLSSNINNNWIIVDVARDTSNLTVYKLGANLADAENSGNVGNTTQNTLDLLSNGFKLRSSLSDTNTSTYTYIYMAFASNPFKYSLAR